MNISSLQEQSGIPDISIKSNFVSQGEEYLSSSEQISLTQAVAPFYIRVSLDNQKVTVFDAQSMILKIFTCSSGKSGSETPTGSFTVSDRGESFYNSNLKEGAYYWTRFYGSYLFHSIPFDENYDVEQDEAEKLGIPASHGCIRLSIDDAKWIYDNIPGGTEVMIQ